MELLLSVGTSTCLLWRTNAGAGYMQGALGVSVLWCCAVPVGSGEGGMCTAQVKRCSVLQTWGKQIAVTMPSSRLVQWSCGVAGAWLHLGSCFWVVSAKASCSSGMGRAVSAFIATPSHPLQQNKVIQLQTFTTEVLCLGFNIYPLLCSL